MPTGTLRSVVVVLTCMWLPSVAVALAAQGEKQDQIGVALAAGTQSAGGDVVLPVTLSAKNVKVGSVDLRITFSGSALAFVQIEPGGLADSVDAAVDAAMLAGPASGESVLHATISTIGPGGSRLPIPAGPIAYITFTVGKTARPQSTIVPKLDARLTTIDDPPVPIAPVTASAGEITVASGPVFGCLFYMH